MKVGGDLDPDSKTPKRGAHCDMLICYSCESHVSLSTQNCRSDLLRRLGQPGTLTHISLTDDDADAAGYLAPGAWLWRLAAELYRFV